MPFMRWRTPWKEHVYGQKSRAVLKHVKCEMPIKILRRNIQEAAETMSLKFEGEFDQKRSLI